MEAVQRTPSVATRVCTQRADLGIELALEDGRGDEHVQVGGLLPLRGVAQRRRERAGPLSQVADHEAAGQAAGVGREGCGLGAAAERVALVVGVVGVVAFVHLEQPHEVRLRRVHRERALADVSLPQPERYVAL